MSASPLVQKLRDDLVTVVNEVSNLWLHHDVFWKMVDIINNNQRVMDLGGNVFDWLKNSYIEVGCGAVRRLLDGDGRSVSLMNVLTTLEQNANTFARFNFQKLIAFEPGSPLHNPEKWQEASQDFDKLFGGGKAELDDALVRTDIDLIRNEGKSIREQVNKEIAHLDRKGMKGQKTTGDLFEKYIERLDEITRKYFYLLTGQ